MLMNYIRYTCSSLLTIQKKQVNFWNRSISEKCCKNSDGKVFKAGSVIEKFDIDDKCKTSRLIKCSILPGDIINICYRSPSNFVML